MEKMYLILAESGGKPATAILIIATAIAIVAITGYFLLRKKK
jgi:LPXTG-motif cell wall-anchored protein